MRERLDRVLFPFILKWIGMESRMACRYFSCSRLLDESEDEAGAKSRTQFNLDTKYQFELQTTYQVLYKQTIKSFFVKLDLFVFSQAKLHKCKLSRKTSLIETKKMQAS